MHAFLVLLAFCGAAWPRQQADRPEAPAPAAAEVQRQLVRLASNDFDVRQQATRWLWEAGPVVQTALRQAVQSGDREVVHRATLILQWIELGIRPNTPQEVVALIHRFQQGDDDVRRVTSQLLLERGEMETVVRLIEQGPVSEQLPWMEEQLSKLVPHLLLSERAALAEKWLYELAITVRIQNYLAAFLQQQDRLQHYIDLAETEARRRPSLAALSSLALLNRARGDREAAIGWMQQAAVPENGWLESLYFENRNWSNLSEDYQQRLLNQPELYDQDIAFLGHLLAFSRLAGRPAMASDARRLIVKLAQDRPRRTFYCGEALLVNGDYEKSVELMAPEDERAAFRLFTSRGRVADAFSLLGIVDLEDSLQAWVDQLIREIPTENDQQLADFELALEMGGLLPSLGYRTTALEVLDQLATAVAADDDPKRLRLLQICELENRLDAGEQLDKHLRTLLNGRVTREILQTLLNENDQEAIYWWNYYSKLATDDPRYKTFGRVRRLLDGKMPPEEFQRLMDERVKLLDAASDDQVSANVYALVATYDHYEQSAAGTQLLAKWRKTPDDAVRLADRHAQDEQWPAAMRLYGEASRQDPLRPLWLYLHGYSLVRNQQQDEGRRKMRLASQMIIDDQDRIRFADQLKDRGLKDEAMHQYQVAWNTSPLPSSLSTLCHRIAVVAHDTDPELAAHRWEQLLLGLLTVGSELPDARGYLQLQFLMNQARARALLDKDRIDDALATIELARQAMPTSSELVEDFVPRLEQLGRQTQADELFGQIYDAQDELCRQFPRSALYLNNLAWMAATQGRRLDDARQLAERAVGLDPDRPTYLDTLAECHFRLGNRAKAIELAARCVKLDPEYTHYQEQLERFQQEPTSRVDQ